VLLQVRLREVFDSFDTDRSGQLSVSELAAFVSALMSNPTEAEITYFQVCVCVLLACRAHGESSIRSVDVAQQAHTKLGITAWSALPGGIACMCVESCQGCPGLKRSHTLSHFKSTGDAGP
jgi:hypothetical protein